MDRIDDLAEAINDVLLGFALSIPLEIAGAIVLRNPPYWYSPFDIMMYKLIILLFAIAIMEAMKRWSFMYTIGYSLGFLIMSAFFGLEVLNLIAIIIIIFVTFLIMITRMKWKV